jgi:hypothetical protein
VITAISEGLVESWATETEKIDPKVEAITEMTQKKFEKKIVPQMKTTDKLQEN